MIFQTKATTLLGKEERMRRKLKQLRRKILVLRTVWNLRVEDSELYKQRMEVLEKNYNDGLCLVRTELNMRLENAQKLMDFEINRIEQFYNV